MTSCPLGIEQLMTCNEVTLEEQIQCFKTAYAITAPHLGHILRLSGYYKYKLRDAQDNIIARFRYSQACCERATTAVQVADSPTILIKPKGNFGMNIYFWEDDRPMLKMKLVSRWRQKYAVLAGDDIEVGSIKKAWGDYVVRFPQDMDVRYKVALLAACIHLRMIKQ